MVDEHASEQAESRVRVDRVLNLIEGFESPYGMELLSTVHWVATHEENVTQGDSVVQAVHSWNTRKKRLMKPEHIQVAWKRLADQGWLAGLKGPQDSTNHSTDHSTAC